MTSNFYPAKHSRLLLFSISLFLTMFTNLNVVSAQTTSPCASSYIVMSTTGNCPNNPSGLCGGNSASNVNKIVSKIRVYYSPAIPVGTATPIIVSASTATSTLSQYRFCVSDDQGTTVARSYVDYCVYSTTNNDVFSSNVISLTVQYGASVLNPCPVINNLPCPSFVASLNDQACTAGPLGVCSGNPAANILVSRIRLYFPAPIPSGTPTPVIFSVFNGLVQLNQYRFCISADQGTNTERIYVDYCVYSTIANDFLPILNSLTFSIQSGSLPVVNCTVPPLPNQNLPCAVTYGLLGVGGGTGGGQGTSECAASFLGCSSNPAIAPASVLYFQSQLRVTFNPCLQPGVAAPDITGFDHIDANGNMVRYCFVANASSSQLINSSRCSVDYCVYSTVQGDNYFVSPPATLQFTLQYNNVPIGVVAGPVQNNCNANLVVLSPLPVVLVAFDATQNRQNVDVQWSTEQEINLDHFEVMRSYDGNRFDKIAEVAARGGSSRTNYQYTDIAPVMGSIYYRLKIVDRDGSVKYSRIVLVTLSTKDNSVVSVSPNPAKDQFKLKLKSFEKGAYRIELYNSIGQKQLVRNISVTQSIQEESFVLPSIRVGVYLVNIINEKTNDTRSIKLVIE